MDDAAGAERLREAASARRLQAMAMLDDRACRVGSSCLWHTSTSDALSSVNGR